VRDGARSADARRAAGDPTLDLVLLARRPLDAIARPDTMCVSHACYALAMQPREITQRELRNDSGEVMRALDAGESFVVTRNGVAVGELMPLRRRRFVSRAAVLACFRPAASVDYGRFRADLDAIAAPDATPRG